MRSRCHADRTTRRRLRVTMRRNDDELRRHAVYLLAWCAAVRASTYALQFAFGSDE